MTLENRLWQDYCRAVKQHHEKQTMETLIEALNSYRVWTGEFLK
jgi:hypothetical protein